LNYTFEERRDIDASGFAFLAVSQRILLICSSGNRGVYAWGEGTRKDIDPDGWSTRGSVSHCLVKVP